MDKELASFHTYLFSLCLNAGAAQATSTGNRQLKLTRRSWLPAEQYCQVEQASTAPAQTSWRTGLISLAMIATLPTYPVHYNSFCGSSHFFFFLQLSRQILDYAKNVTLITDFSIGKDQKWCCQIWHRSEADKRQKHPNTPNHALSPKRYHLPS